MIRRIVLLLTLTLFVFTSPAEAGRFKEKRNSRPVAVHKAIAKAKLKPLRPQSKMTRLKSKVKSIFSWAGQRSFRPAKAKESSKNRGKRMRLREGVKDAARKVKKLANKGFLQDAAEKASDVPREPNGQFLSPKLSIRERFTKWRATNKVIGLALAQGKSRSKRGDLNGTRDALSALTTLKSDGQLGFVARLRMRSLKRLLVKRIGRKAKSSFKRGDVKLATERIAFVTELSTVQGQKLGATMVKQSLSLARSYAKKGKINETYDALQMTGELAQEGGLSFPDAKAESILHLAVQESIAALTARAERVLKKGKTSQALELIAEARSIQSSGSFKLSKATKRSKASVERDLGPTLIEYEADVAAASSAAP